ncbi:hypothetical protein [Streptomyces sp. NPDC018610]|uniref:hypothetical protein n=1 Tax=Streptomyces sp. NPDC018610 TaxID=3365049 RepID=UPI0037B6684E
MSREQTPADGAPEGAEPAHSTAEIPYTTQRDAIQYDGPSSHLVLRDAHGNRLELDPRILLANPLLWHELDTGVRRSLERGTLRQGADVLHRLGERIDDETAQAVLRASGLF